MKAVFIAMLMALSTQGAFADQSIDGQLNAPERTSNADGSVTYSDFYIRVAYGSAMGFDSILNVNADAQSAAFLCQDAEFGGPGSTVVNITTGSSLFSKQVAMAAADGRIYATKSSTYIKTVTCRK